MSIWPLLWTVCGAGAVGGAVNALLSDNGFPLPRVEDFAGGYIIRPGAVGNTIVGAVAAGVSWGLYGPLSTATLLRTSASGTAAPTAGLTLASLIGAVLVGMGGARWLTNEVDKRLLRAAASSAVAAPAAPNLAEAILTATPARVLGMVRRVKGEAVRGGRGKRCRGE